MLIHSKIADRFQPEASQLSELTRHQRVINGKCYTFLTVIHACVHNIWLQVLLNHCKVNHQFKELWH